MVVGISRSSALAAGLALALGCRSSAPRGGAPSPQPSASAAAARIVSIGGGVTETVFAIGCGDRVVATDTSSFFPAATHALPKVGYQRTIAAEGVLAQRPSLVLASDETGPPTALAQLESSGVRVERLGQAFTVDAARERIRRIAGASGCSATGAVERFDREVGEARALVARATSRPRALFVYARGQGTLQVAGAATAAHSMIELAGAVNAISDFEGFRPLSSEGAIGAAPDVVVLLAHGVQSLGGSDAIWALPGLSETPAGKAKRAVVMDDLLLLGFGPRLGEAIGAFARELHAELPRAGAP